jgi:hypothetical protein
MAVLKAAAEIVASGQIEFGPEGDPGSEAISLAARFENWVYRDVSEIPF